MSKYLIGIDPGVKTGFSVWDRYDKSFSKISTLTILRAMDTILFHFKNNSRIKIEDARLRKWFGNAGRERLKGVGSVNRDCSIWEEFCTMHDLPFDLVHPKDNVTKLDAKMFGEFTGYDGRTSEHGRDAAMLVWKKRWLRNALNTN